MLSLSDPNVVPEGMILRSGLTQAPGFDPTLLESMHSVYESFQHETAL